MLTAEQLLEQQVFSWFHNNSMDDAENVIWQCIPVIAAGQAQLTIVESLKESSRSSRLQCQSVNSPMFPHLFFENNLWVIKCM